MGQTAVTEALEDEHTDCLTLLMENKADLDGKVQVRGQGGGQGGGQESGRARVQGGRVPLVAGGAGDVAAERVRWGGFRWGRSVDFTRHRYVADLATGAEVSGER